MTTQAQERRTEGQGRMPVETLVEVVGNEPGIPAFEAESVDVSSRGMHLRTAYLPDEGAPLVCRFEEHGREIVVEGVVAWRREGARGGEFGVEFTALDARSVDALRELCSGGEKAESEAEPAAAPAEPPHGSGTKVRLHIDGLGSPMKARVRSGDPQRVQVGSSLEFLKVGRRLEIEDLERGGRRTAHIDSVNVAIDPESRVPQLVVALRYEGAAGAEESTPEPSVADLSGELQPRTLRIPSEDVSVASGAPADDQIEDEGDREVEALRGKLGVAATHAGVAAVSAGKRMAALSSSAATNFSGWLRGATAKVGEMAKREKPPARRTTAPAPSAPATQGQRLRPQSGEKAAAAATPKAGLTAARTAWSNLPKKKKLMASAGVAVMLATIVALASHRSAPPPGAEAALPKAEPAVVGAAAAAAPAGMAAPVEAAPNALSEANGVVSADVPLFGATPMATMEPAPLAPPPSGASEEAAEKAEAKASVSAAADDESFPEEGDSKSKQASKKPEDVAPWGRGKVTNPVIHRLRLDSAGDALQGSLQPTGFTVVVPNRKVMEQGAAIAKRDPRIARVRTVNTPNGAQITFQFKDGVPAYRARLRRDFIEILVGAAEPKKPEKAAADPKKAASASVSGKDKSKSKPAAKPAK
jgi:hypothetical protein